jgi:hypothetical protein
MTRPLLKFFLLTYAVSWMCWTAAGAISRGSARTLAEKVFLLGKIVVSTWVQAAKKSDGADTRFRAYQNASASRPPASSWE